MNKEKLRYAILNEIHKGNSSLTEIDFHATEEEFDEAVTFLSRENYIVGVHWADNRPWLYKIGPSLTEKGEAYLQKNSVLSKTYRGLKEIREWIKL